MNQLAFSLCRASDPLSSELAADSLISSGRRADQQQATLFAVRLWPGSTCRELAMNLAERDGRHWMEHSDYLHKRLHEVAERGPMRACKYTRKLVLTWNPL